MKLFQYNTMRLVEAPTEVASTTRKAWDALFEVYSFDTFHPMEGRGVLRHALALRLPHAANVMENLIVRGFAIAP